MPVTVGSVILVCIGYAAFDAPVATSEDGEPVLRPAVVTRVWGDDCVNAQVLLDGTNDLRFADGYPPGILSNENCDRGMKWATSACRGTGIGEWRWSGGA